MKFADLLAFDYLQEGENLEIWKIWKNLEKKKLKIWKIWKIFKNLEILEIFGLPWSALICLGLLGLFQITIERLKCSKAISGRVGLEISVGTDSKSTALRC